MSRYGKIRAVVVQSARDKKRSAIYTNGREDEIGAPWIVHLICRRWGEENAIKELLLKHLINYMPGYVTEELEPQPLVDNPAVIERKQQRAGLVSELNRLKIELADHVLPPPAGKLRPKLRSPAEVLERIVVTESAILITDQQLEKLPAEVHFDEAQEGGKLRRLNYEKKRFLDCVKVFVANLKSQLCPILRNHDDREKEVLPVWSMMVERTGYVKLEEGRLHVTLRRFTDREIADAARHLCEDLNDLGPVTLDRYHFPIRYHTQ